MAGENENKQNTSGQRQDEEAIHGRIHNSQNPEIEQKQSAGDISGIDQQEGNMNHGESGGNLDREKSGS